MRRLLSCFCLVLGCATAAQAQAAGVTPLATPSEDPPAAGTPSDVRADLEAPRTWLNLRGGFGNQPIDAAAGARPQICAEVSPLDFFGIEACGTGNGFLFEPGSELVHFRGKLRLASMTTSEAGTLSPHVALGFAELQVGDDGPGFDFFGTGATGVETAGPEAGASLRWSYPLPWDFEVIADASLALAWLPHAPALTTSMSPWQPSGAVTVGVGW